MVSAIYRRRGDVQPASWVSLEALPAVPTLATGCAAGGIQAEVVTSANVHKYLPGEESLAQARALLVTQGAEALASSPFGHSMRMPRRLFERLLGCSVERRPVSDTGYWSDASRIALAADTDWEQPSVPGLRELVIVQPHLFFTSPVPPTVPFHHLRLADLPLLTGAVALHRQGITGRDVRIVLVDSGAWLDHAFFRLSNYNVTVEAAADCPNNSPMDHIGHGTAVLANILAMAPDAALRVIKTGANLVCAFRQAAAYSPDIICLSAGYDLHAYRSEPRGVPLFAKPLEIEIAHATANGIVVVAPVGNGHLAFPGMHTDVICAGGVYIDRCSKPIASDYCSAYQAPWYENRWCPDLCGLSGLHPAAAYIMSPVPTGSQIDRDAWDLTGPTDSWSVIGGSSLCAAHIAGACALALQQVGTLKTADLRDLLLRHSRQIDAGERNVICVPATDPDAVDHLPTIALIHLADLRHV